MKEKRRVYDHRIKQAIARTGNINLLPELKIPKTTTKNWIHRGVGEVVTNDTFDLDREALELKCFELEEQVTARANNSYLRPLTKVSPAGPGQIRAEIYAQVLEPFLADLRQRRRRRKSG